MRKNKLTIPRDFTFNKDAIISYWENLNPFRGEKINQGEISDLLKKKYPNNPFYNSLDRKFATLKFYGLVHFEEGKLQFNPHFDNYVDALKKEEGVINSFLNILKESRFPYFKNSRTNFFEIVITFLLDKTILYLDHIDVITYLQYFDKINDIDLLIQMIKQNRSLNFNEKVEMMEGFYRTYELGDIATPLHDARYLFTYLEANGFYTVKNSLQSKKYFQKDGTPRRLEDRRLYLSEELLDLVHGYSYDDLIDDIHYNNEVETEYYEVEDLGETKTIEKSNETVKSISKRYKTDKKLRNTALKRTSYSCELAKLKGEEHETFLSRVNNSNYAEVHHLVPMHTQENESFIYEEKLISLDQISNLIVLCPTCHRKIHYGRNEDVKPELELLFEYRKDDLIRSDININKNQLLNFYRINQ
jgi:hypothetical protein